MKKVVWTFVIVLVLAAFASAAEGPLDKGSFKLGGNVYFMMQSGDLYEDENDDSYWTFDFSPSIGYFVTPGLLVGIDLGLYQTWQGEYDRTTSLYLGPSVTFYFRGAAGKGQIKGALYPYVKGFFSVGHLKHKSLHTVWIMDEPYTYEGEATVDETRFGGEAGALFMISNTVGLTFGATLISKDVEWDYSDVGGSTASLDGTTFMLATGVTYFIY